MSDENSRADGDDNKEDDQRVPLGTSTLEWIVAVIGAVIVFGIAVYLAYNGFTQPDSPPELIVEQTGFDTGRSGYLVLARVRNDGPRPAATVRLSGELFQNDRLIQRSTVEIDSVPQNSERSFGLQFTEDPRQYRMILRVEGFSDP